MDIENNNVYKHDEKVFDMYEVVVRPMLCIGHEGELIMWLKEMGLLRSSVGCSNPTCQRRWLNWMNARIVDKYIWICPTCCVKASIRDGSFFNNFKCGIKIVIQAVMGWCQQASIEMVCQIIDTNSVLKSNIVKQIYKRCSETASYYVLEHWQHWCLGGPGSVVLIDVFPDGYVALEPKMEDETAAVKRKVRQHILCLAELNSVPPRAWLQVVKPQSGYDKSSKANPSIVEDALLLVRRHVLPGTALVANYKTQCCSMEEVRKLEGYASVTSVEMLMKLDRPGSRRLQDNLETIWQSIAYACKDIQAAQHNERGATLDLHEYMWRQSFAPTPSKAFENMLHHISEQYSFKD